MCSSIIYRVGKRLRGSYKSKYGSIQCCIQCDQKGGINGFSPGKDALTHAEHFVEMQSTFRTIKLITIYAHVVMCRLSRRLPEESTDPSCCVPTNLQISASVAEV